MGIVFALLILAAGAGLAYYVYQKRQEPSFHFRQKKLFSNAEELLYWKLVGALPDHVILPKVPLIRMLSSSGQNARAAIATKKVDFLVCARNFDIVAAIDLEEKSRRKKKVDTEDVKETAMETAEIKYIVWSALALPSDADILQRVLGIRQKPVKLAIATMDGFNTENGTNG
jgi:hypothetical protein